MVIADTPLLRRVLATNGRCVVRCFVQAKTPEPVGGVLEDLARGRVGGFHAFKWRLAMALQADSERGVVLADVWDALQEAEPDLVALSSRIGWPVEVIRTIDAYRGVGARYWFPSSDTLRDLLSNAGFAILDVIHPAYELGDRCPSMVLADIESPVGS